jgi:hypothetical protein
MIEEQVACGFVVPQRVAHGGSGTFWIVNENEFFAVTDDHLISRPSMEEPNANQGWSQGG